MKAEKKPTAKVKTPKTDSKKAVEAKNEKHNSVGQKPGKKDGKSGKK